jgi:hypothetical protein
MSLQELLPLEGFLAELAPYRDAIRDAIDSLTPQDNPGYPGEEIDGAGRR